jgi:hypothetical protein
VLYLSNGRFVLVIRDEKLRSVPSLWEIVVPLTVHHCITSGCSTTLVPLFTLIMPESLTKQFNVLLLGPPTAI